MGAQVLEGWKRPRLVFLWGLLGCLGTALCGTFGVERSHSAGVGRAVKTFWRR